MKAEIKPVIFPGEALATRQVLEAGKNFGYGNMIAWLMKAWACKLIKDGLSPKAAISFVSNRGPYPPASDFPIAFKDLGFEP